MTKAGSKGIHLHMYHNLKHLNGADSGPFGDSMVNKIFHGQRSNLLGILGGGAKNPMPVKKFRKFKHDELNSMVDLLESKEDTIYELQMDQTGVLKRIIWICNDQLELLCKYHEIILVDGIHCVTPFNFEMMTICIIDCNNLTRLACQMLL